MPIAGMAEMSAGPLSPAAMAALQTALGGAAPQAVFPGAVLFGDDCVDGAAAAAAVEGDLHNAGELTRALNLGTLNRGTLTPAQLAAAAYARWGQAAWPRLVGEWSLALYDPGARRLSLAADHAGVVPLYYAQQDSRLLWSSDLAVLARLNLASQPDPDYLAAFIGGMPDSSQSPYRGIALVPTASVLVLDQGLDQALDQALDQPRITVSKYRTFAPPAPLRYRTDEEYAEHFWHLWRQAVMRRIPAQGGVWAELSGGLDSSSIVATALVGEAGEELRKRFTAVFYATGEHEGSRDRSSMEAVAAHSRCPVREIDITGQSMLPPAVPSLFIGAGSVMETLGTAMAAAGDRRLLSGAGGDATMWNVEFFPCFSVRESLAAGRLREGLRDLMGYATVTGRSASDLVRRDVFGSATWRPRMIPRPSHRAWFTAEARARVRAVELPATPPGRHPAVAAAYDFIEQAKRLIWWMAYRQLGLTPSYPYYDADLIEFMLAIPFRQKIRPGLTRYVQRRALRGVLPEETRTRTDKSIGTPVYFAALRREWDAVEPLLGDDMRLGAMGLITPALLRADVAQARAGFGPGLHSLWRILAAEQWLRGNWG